MVFILASGFNSWYRTHLLLFYPQLPLYNQQRACSQERNMVVDNGGSKVVSPGLLKAQRIKISRHLWHNSFKKTERALATQKGRSSSKNGRWNISSSKGQFYRARCKLLSNCKGTFFIEKSAIEILQNTLRPRYRIIVFLSASYALALLLPPIVFFSFFSPFFPIFSKLSK